MSQECVILVIDDDEDDRFFFEEAARETPLNLQLITATDGVNGLSLLATLASLPHLIFLDLNMPRMNGREFLKEIKTRDGLNAIPIIIYSTSKEPQDVADLHRLGASAYVQKPTSFDDLCDIICNQVERFFKPAIVDSEKASS